ncbi:MAG: LpqB family beta-propeller domain-containing protein [Sporichthyaceae bacterium]
MTDVVPVRMPCRAVALAAGLTLLAGCAQIPSRGSPQGQEVTGVSPPAGPNPQVRVLVEGPRAGDNVFAVVSGFLEASGAVEAGFATARKYLTSGASTGWRPESAITIFDHTALELQEQSESRLVLSAPAEGVVDAQGVLRAAPPGRKVRAEFGMVRVGGEWLIDTVPDGLFISRQDFDREYARIETYFLTRAPRTTVLVPDLIYASRSAGLATERIQALLRGPSRWLSSVVESAAPPGAALVEPVAIRSGIARVRLSAESLPSSGSSQDLLLAQVVMTMTEDPEVTAVEVFAGEDQLRLGGAGDGQLIREDITPYLPPDQRPPPPTAVFLRGGAAHTAGPTPLQGPLDPQLRLAEITVAPGAGTLAAISADRATLWTAAPDAPRRLAVRLRGSGIRSISFDGDGNLWAVEGSGGATRVLRIPRVGEPVVTELTGFIARQVVRLRVSADGVRMALVLDTVSGRQVFVALVSELGSGGRLFGLLRLAYGIVDPTDVDWGGPGSLVVLGAEPNAQPQPFGVALDGTLDEGTAPLADMVAVTVAPNVPMIAATSRKRIWRLRDDGTWIEIGVGRAPSYPG